MQPKLERKTILKIRMRGNTEKFPLLLHELKGSKIKMHQFNRQTVLVDVIVI